MKQAIDLHHAAQKLISGVASDPVNATTHVMARNHIKQKTFDAAHAYHANEDVMRYDNILEQVYNVTHRPREGRCLQDEFLTCAILY